MYYGKQPRIASPNNGAISGQRVRAKGKGTGGGGDGGPCDPASEFRKREKAGENV